MRIIRPAILIEDDLESLGVDMLKKIEKFTRKCYKSEDKITPDSYKEFVPRIYKTRKHEGIIEHRSVSVTVITDRGVSHEFVRHRMASYLQESTRYCDYSPKGKMKHVTFILPSWCEDLKGRDYNYFRSLMSQVELNYNYARDVLKWKPEEARALLPNALKTEFTATMNLGGWMNFFRKRTAEFAHPQMRQVAVSILSEFKKNIPYIFDDIEIPELPYPAANVITDLSEVNVIETLPPLQLAVLN